jgi:hypothetical protein
MDSPLSFIHAYSTCSFSPDTLRVAKKVIANKHNTHDRANKKAVDFLLLN